MSWFQIKVWFQHISRNSQAMFWRYERTTCSRRVGACTLICPLHQREKETWSDSDYWISVEVHDGLIRLHVDIRKRQTSAQNTCHKSMCNFGYVSCCVIVKMQNHRAVSSISPMSGLWLIKPLDTLMVRIWGDPWSSNEHHSTFFFPGKHLGKTLLSRGADW